MLEYSNTCPQLFLVNKTSHTCFAIVPSVTRKTGAGVSINKIFTGSIIAGMRVASIYVWK
jgi:hypothetical protein